MAAEPGGFESTPVRIGVLGPLSVEVGGVARSAGPPLRQAVLAFLSARAGTAVSKEQLMDAIWGQQLPDNANGNLHTYIARLRKLLEPDRRQRAVDGILATVHGGYHLRLAPTHLDSARFLALRTRARGDRGHDAAGAAASLQAALRLWRGSPLQGVPGPFAAAERERLTGLWLSTVEEYATLLVDLGEPDLAVEQLSPVVRDHPLRESAHAGLMTALERSGRRDEALTLYGRIVRELRTTLGVTPGAALREVHRTLSDGAAVADDAVHGEPESAPTSLAVAPATSTPVDHLPPRPGRFVGRAADLAALDRTLAAGQRPRLCVVDGGGGIGKTTLTLEWAHRSAAAFPDGCLYADLRGFNPTDVPAAASEVLYDFLVALGVSGDQVPRTVTSRAALFRSRTRDRRLLLVLDDAGSAEQVAPLLVAAPGCAVIVTSRRRLESLVVRYGARPLRLGPMTDEDARALFAAAAGAARAAAEPEAACALVRGCAGLPLTVAVIGTCLLGDAPGALGELLDRLRGHTRKLDVLSGGAPGADTDLRTVFRASVAQLSAPAREAFCLLSVFPTAHIDVPAAGALLDRAPREVTGLLAELTRDNLLAEVETGGYRFHDLLREFAREHAAQSMAADEVAAARDRLLRWTLHAVREASALIEPARMNDLYPVEPTPWSVGGPTDRAGAVRWLAGHQRSVVATAEIAFACGRFDVAWQIAAILTTWFYVRKDWALWLRSARNGARAARRDGARIGLAQLRGSQGMAHLDLRDFRQARKQLRRAAAEFQRIGDYWSLGTALVPIGKVYLQTGRPEQAMHAFEAAHRAYRRTEDLWGTAWALTAMGSTLAVTGRPGEATTMLERAVSLWRKSGYTRGEADAMTELAQAQIAADQLPQARRTLCKAERTYQNLGDRYRYAQALVWIGKLDEREGDTAAARTAWRAAMAIFEALTAPDTTECLRLLGEH